MQLQIDHDQNRETKQRKNKAAKQHVFPATVGPDGF